MTYSNSKPTFTARASAFIGRATFTLAASGAWVASCGFNALTGAAMGGDDMTKTWLWVVAAVSLDMLKAGSAVKLRTALTSRAYGLALVAGTLVMVSTAVSLISALTMRANGTADHEAVRLALVERRASVKDLIRSSTAALASLPVSRLPAVIDRDLAMLKGKSPWTSSSGCTDATVPASKTLCREYSNLVVEREASIKRADLVGTVADARHNLDTMPAAKASASPVANALVVYLSAVDIETDADTVASWLIIFLTISIEFGAVAGPALASGSGSRLDPKLIQLEVVPTQAANDDDQRDSGRVKAVSLAHTKATLVQHLRSGNGLITSSTRALADQIGASQSTISRAIRALEAAGTIERGTNVKGKTVIKLAA